MTYTLVKFKRKFSRSKCKTGLIKPTILHFTNEEINQKFVPTNKNEPFMDIIKSTESCDLDKEYNRKENKAETLG